MQKPLIDIVMLVHDCWEWADLSIRAVEHHTKNAYRLILVDMASVERQTREGLLEAEERGHTVVRLATNKSFSHGVNAGVKTGSAPNIVVLNDDAIVTDAWDTCFLDELASPDVGMVGARTNFALGAMGDSSFPRALPAPFLVFVCVGLRRDTWEKIGPMDEENFDGFSCEDLDYSWRVRKAGLKLYVSGAFVFHAGSRTLAKAGVDASAETRAKHEQKYHNVLQRKWGMDWYENPANSAHMPKVLVCAYSATELVSATFMDCLLKMRSTEYPWSFIHQRRTQIQMARNAVADYAVDNGFDYLVQLDDDATFPQNLIPHFINHGKDVVCALAYGRFPPYPQVAYELKDDDFDKDGNPTITKDGLKLRATIGIENTGLRRVDISGFHVSMMKTSVIRRLRATGLRAYYGGFDNKLGEDFAMCINLRKAGIDVWLDTNVPVGHLGQPVNVTKEYVQEFRAGRAK